MTIDHPFEIASQEYMDPYTKSNNEDVKVLCSRIVRKKGQSGKAITVQCIQCGKVIPRDKAVEKRKSTLPLSHRLRSLLKSQGAMFSSHRTIVYYCISCARHRKYI